MVVPLKLCQVWHLAILFVHLGFALATATEATAQATTAKVASSEDTTTPEEALKEINLDLVIFDPGFNNHNTPGTISMKTS